MIPDLALNLHKSIVAAKVKTCKACPLSQAHTPVPFYVGERYTVDKGLVVIGEAPGKQEDEAGVPFVGPSGKLLKKWLAGVGWDEEEFAFVNTVCCWPGSARQTPTGNEVKACNGNLIAQLGALSPRYVLCVGGIATSSWWPNIRMGEMRGQWFRLPLHGPGSSVVGPWAIATWHPAAVLRNPALDAEARGDVTRLRLTSITGRDSTAPAVGVPLNRKCTACKRLPDHWESEPGIESEIGEGLAWCQVHWEQRMGGKGKAEKAGKAGKRTGKRAAKKAGPGLF